jgi:benzoylformate decarboxylase
VALAERHDMPVWVAPFSSRCGFPEDHRLFAGFLPAFRETIVNALTGHDLIIVLGGPLSLYHAEGFGPHLPQGSELIAIGDNVAHATWAPTGDAIVANVRSAVERLLESPASPRPVGKKVNSCRPTLSSRPFSDAYLFQQIARLRPSDSIIVEEAPSSRDALQKHLPMLQPDSFFTCASGGLGHGLLAAVGVALGQPSRKTIAILGDGSSMYAIQGLWSAAQLNVSLSIVIVNNGRYQALETFGRLFGIQQPVGTNLPHLDFCGLAGSQGLESQRVTDAGQLDDMLEWSFSASSPTLLEVMVD